MSSRRKASQPCLLTTQQTHRLHDVQPVVVALSQALETNGNTTWPPSKRPRESTVDECGTDGGNCTNGSDCIGEEDAQTELDPQPENLSLQVASSKPAVGLKTQNVALVPDDRNDDGKATTAEILLAHTPIMQRKGCQNMITAVDCRNADCDDSVPVNLATSQRRREDVIPPNASPESQGKLLSTTTTVKAPPNFEAPSGVFVPVAFRTYDSSLDINSHLMQAFGQFPYPTHTEMLTLALRHRTSLEIIKAWFEAQRLKNGISWTPEDVQEARRRVLVREGSIGSKSDVDNDDGGKSACNGIEEPMNLELQIIAVAPTPLMWQRWETRLEETHPAAKQSVCMQYKQWPEHQSSYEQPQWPDAAELSRLCANTGLSPQVVSKWFDDRQYKLYSHTDTIHISGDKNDGDADGSGAEQNVLSEHLIQENDENIEAIKAFPFQPEELLPSHSQTKLHSKETSPTTSVPQKGKAQLRSKKTNRFQKKTPEQLAVMKEVFLITQWPSKEEYDELELRTGLRRSDVVRWFGDTRYALKHKQLRWARCIESVLDVRSCKAKPAISKAGTAALCSYYTRRKFVKECDLDKLCERSGLGYQLVRDWFSKKRKEDNIGDDYEDCSEKGVEDESWAGDLTDNSDDWTEERELSKVEIAL
uniref:Homeobox domain-containing protein n=1 Tax=Eptatretus burgeri TaxID=7764 RepID=A0A8C4NFJ8_EPTBU